MLIEFNAQKLQRLQGSQCCCCGGTVGDVFQIELLCEDFVPNAQSVWTCAPCRLAGPIAVYCLLCWTAGREADHVVVWGEDHVHLMPKPTGVSSLEHDIRNHPEEWRPVSFEESDDCSVCSGSIADGTPFRVHQFDRYGWQACASCCRWPQVLHGLGRCHKAARTGKL